MQIMLTDILFGVAPVITLNTSIDPLPPVFDSERQ